MTSCKYFGWDDVKDGKPLLMASQSGWSVDVRSKQRRIDPKNRWIEWQLSSSSHFFGFVHTFIFLGLGYIYILYPCVHIITYRECLFGSATNRMCSSWSGLFWIISWCDPTDLVELQGFLAGILPPTGTLPLPCEKEPKVPRIERKSGENTIHAPLFWPCDHARTLLKKAKSRMKKTHLLFESDDIAYISLSYAVSQFRVKWSQRFPKNVEV